MRYISSQEYLNDEVVEQKRADKDYMVSVSPVFAVDGEEYRVVVDGHHSLAAALADGVDPEYHEVTEQEDDRICLLSDGRIEEFLETEWIDSNWHDVFTGREIW
jgi:hypothetical protein